MEDTGIGIKPEGLKRLFVEFQQLDASAAKKHAGTGLGLALTKRLVEAQQGQVGARSSPGTGSVFYAILPRAAQAAATPHTAEPDRASPATGPRILVVEDEAGDRELLVRTLSRAGYTVETADTGRAALDMLQARPFAGITLDLNLPDLSGRDLLKLLRAAPGPNRETPVIVVTGGSPKGILAGIRVQEILRKPIDEGLLVAALDRAGLRGDQSRPVLVVDSDLDALKFAEAALQKKGYRVVCRRDGESALDALEELHPAAIILDLDMEGMEGPEFLVKLRQRPNGRDVPVIIWTLKDLSREEREALLAQAQALVLKDEGAEALLGHLGYHVPVHAADSEEGSGGR